MKNYAKKIGFLEKYFSSISIAKLFLSILTFVVFISFILISGRSYLLIDSILVSLIFTFIYFSYLPLNILRVLERAKFISLIGLLERFVSLLLVALFLFLGKSLLFVLIALLVLL